MAELGLTLAAGDRLRNGPAGIELRDGEELPLLDSVRDAMLLRASGLPVRARMAIAVAAVAGQTFALESAMQIAGLDAWPEEPERLPEVGDSEA